MNTVFSIMLMAYTASLVVHFVVASMAIDTMQKTMARRGSLPRWTHDYCERAGVRIFENRAFTTTLTRKGVEAIFNPMFVPMVNTYQGLRTLVLMASDAVAAAVRRPAL